MTDLVRIPVPGGLVTHKGVLHEVVLKPPSYDDFLTLGEIETYGRSPDGTVFMVENGETLRSYIEKCLVEPKDPLALGQGGVKLARAVKGAVLGFSATTLRRQNRRRPRRRPRLRMRARPILSRRRRPSVDPQPRRLVRPGHGQGGGAEAQSRTVMRHG